MSEWAKQPTSKVPPVPHYGDWQKPMPDDIKQRFEEHPEDFVVTTASGVYLKEDMERWSQQMRDEFVSVRPPQEWNETVRIEILSCWDTVLPENAVLLNGQRVLVILAHGDDGFGVYRWIHEPAIHCCETYAEACEWAREYCRSIMDNPSERNSHEPHRHSGRSFCESIR